MCLSGFEWRRCGGGGGLGWWGEVAVCSVVVVVSWCPCQWKGLDGVAGLNVHGFWVSGLGLCCTCGMMNDVEGYICRKFD